MEGPLTQPYPFAQSLRERISTHLSQHDRVSLDVPDARQAAVAFVLVADDDGQAAFLLTRRASRLSAHSKQFALPGGRLDAGETAIDAARRETREEIGLEIPATNVVGLLDDYLTRSGYIMTPVVMWLPDAPDPVPNPGEVESVWPVPLADLDHPDVPRWLTIPESPHPVIQVPLSMTTVHAPTGALIYQLREVALHGRLVRTDVIEEPTWAWH